MNQGLPDPTIYRFGTREFITLDDLFLEYCKYCIKNGEKRALEKPAFFDQVAAAGEHILEIKLIPIGKKRFPREGFFLDTIVDVEFWKK